MGFLFFCGSQYRTTHHQSVRTPYQGEARGLRGLHLADTGVYKKESDFIEKSSYFSSQLVVN